MKIHRFCEIQKELQLFPEVYILHTAGNLQGSRHRFYAMAVCCIENNTNPVKSYQLGETTSFKFSSKQILKKINRYLLSNKTRWLIWDGYFQLNNIGGSS